MNNEIEFVEVETPLKRYKVFVNGREIGFAHKWSDTWFVAEIDAAPNYNTYLHSDSLEELSEKVDGWAGA